MEKNTKIFEVSKTNIMCYGIRKRFFYIQNIEVFVIESVILVIILL